MAPSPCESEARDGNAAALGRSAPLVVLTVLLVLTVALGLRLYRLGAESVGLEEYVGFAHLDAPDLATYIHLTRQLYRPMGPFPYVLLYCWSHTVGNSVVALRLLSVGLGVLAVGVLYAFTRSFYGGGRFGHRAGIVAALCLTLSPVHIFFSQEARQYPILTLAALASAFTLLRATRTKQSRWLASNALANLAAAAAHPLGVLVMWTEGIYLLLRRPLRWRPFAVWVALHMLVAGGWFLWVKDVSLRTEDILGADLPTYTWHALVTDLFRDDVIYAGTSAQPAETVWPFLTPGLVARFHGAHIVLDKLLIAAGLGAVLWALARVLRHDPIACASDDGALESPDRGDFLFLLLWFLVPALTLALISVWSYCAVPRYTSYSAFALYALLGGGVASISSTRVRAATTVAVALLYAYQMLLILPGPVRTDHRAAAALVRSSGSPDDLILSPQGHLWLPVFLYNLGATAHPASMLFRVEDVCEIAEFYLKARQALGAPSTEPGLWVIVVREGVYNSGGLADFEAGARSRGWDVALTEFAGERRLLVYRVRLPASSDRPVSPGTVVEPATGLAQAIAAAPTSPALTAFRSSIVFSEDRRHTAYTRLGVALAEKGQIPLAAYAFAQALRLRPENIWPFADLQHELSGSGDYDRAGLAIATMLDASPDAARQLCDVIANRGGRLSGNGILALARKALERDPGCARAHAAEGIAFEKLGQIVAATHAYQKAIEVDPNQDSSTYISLGHLLMQNGRVHEAADVFRKGAARHPQAAWLYARLGVTLLTLGDVEGSVEALRRAAATEAGNANILTSYGEALMAQGNYLAAIPVLRSALQLDAANPVIPQTLWRAALGAGDDNTADEAFQEIARQDPSRAEPYRTLWDALRESHDYDAAWKEVKRLRANGTSIATELLGRLAGESGRQE